MASLTIDTAVSLGDMHRAVAAHYHQHIQCGASNLLEDALGDIRNNQRAIRLS
jgi:hypothetical protein